MSTVAPLGALTSTGALQAVAAARARTCASFRVHVALLEPFCVLPVSDAEDSTCARRNTTDRVDRESQRAKDLPHPLFAVAAVIAIRAINNYDGRGDGLRSSCCCVAFGQCLRHC